MKKLLCLLATSAALFAAQAPAHAGIADIAGTESVQNLLGANDRGDLFWQRTGDNAMFQSRRGASGTYQHTRVNLSFPGFGSGYGQLAANGDAVWLQFNAWPASNIYHFDAATGASRQLTFYTPIATSPRLYPAVQPPVVAASGNAAWGVWYPFCNGCADGGYHIEYFNKATGLATRITTEARGLGAPTFNSRNQVFWFELGADQLVRLRRFDPLTGVTSILLTRPAGTRASTVLVNDLGDMAWLEISLTNYQSDVWTYDQRLQAVRRITTDGSGSTSLRLNAMGDLAWQSGPSIWQFDRRTDTTRRLTTQSSYNSDYFMNDLGDMAWSFIPQEGKAAMQYTTRATAEQIAVGGTQTYPLETQPRINGAGDLFYVRRPTPGSTFNVITRAARSFLCN